MKHETVPSQQKKARNTCLGLGIVALACFVVFGAMAWRLGPPVGDLTRISGLSEKRFGWRRTAERYEQDHFVKLSLGELISQGGQGEILVFGDSFTDAEQTGTSWLNSLHEQTGATIDFVEFTTLTDVLEVMQAGAASAKSPKVIILEMGERTVFRRAKPLFESANCAKPKARTGINTSLEELAKIPWTRRGSFAGFDEILSWGALASRRRIFASSKTVILDLNRDDLFTSASSGQLLIYQSDIIRHTEKALFPFNARQAKDGIICALRHTINSAADGTEVYVLVAPDKRTLYEPWIADVLPSKAIDILTFLPGTLNGRFIDVLDLLRSDVLSGRDDVYFPNDTHWNDTTARKIGIVVADMISDAKDGQ